METCFTNGSPFGQHTISSRQFVPFVKAGLGMARVDAARGALEPGAGDPSTIEAGSGEPDWSSLVVNSEGVDVLTAPDMPGINRKL